MSQSSHWPQASAGAVTPTIPRFTDRKPHLFSFPPTTIKIDNIKPESTFVSMEQLREHFTVWTIVCASQLTAYTVHDWNAVASIFALICGGIASLAFAYYNITKSRNRK